MKKRFASFAALLLTLALAQVVAAPAVHAAEHEHEKVVSTTPVNNTPHVLDGIVFSIAEVGDLIVLGGSFTQVQAASGGAVLTRNRIVAFNKNTGVISTSFAPSFNSTVRSVVAAPDGQSVYIGGQFGTMNGASVSKVVRLNLSNGQRVAAFNAPLIDAVVHDMNLSGNRLFIGGEFTRIGNQDRTKLAELNPTSGEVRANTNILIEGMHYGGSTFVHKFDVSADGTKLVATGNFRTMDGLDRVQVGMIDISGDQATVANWHTDRWKPMCYNSFSYYLNDLDFAPDGSYFVLGSMGGYGSGPPSLCDSISRWETAATGNAINPEWVDYTGGDSVYALEATGDTIYFGGHMRWVNNPFRADAAGQGAVEREGIGALNASNGMPNAWNPGRDRGRGVFDMLATEQGLWVGSDTDRIARYLYRGRIALFPLATGSTIPTATPAVLPVDVLQAGSASVVPDARYLYRVNAAGSTIPSIDGGMDWLGDGVPPASAYRTQDNNAATYDTVGALHSSVPSSTPREIFSAERWDPEGGNEMAWAFPVTAGKNVQVRIYLSNRYDGTSQPGQRVFGIQVDGQSAFPSVDLSATPGHNTGYMLSRNIVSDGVVDVRFVHLVENPLVNGLEIVDLDASAPDPGAAGQAREIYFNGTIAGSKGVTDITSNVSWDDVRGGFATSDSMYLAMANGQFQKRSFDGQALGAASTLELYGLTNFSSEVQSMTGMFLWNNRIYFTLAGQNALYMRYLDLDSSIVGAQRFTVANQVTGFSWANVRGMFLSGDKLYVATPNGTLSELAWNTNVMDGGASGTPNVVSGPELDGVNWTSRALISMPSDGAPPLPNVAPTAVIGSECEWMTCLFTSEDSSDSDGELVGFAWVIDGEAVSTEASFTHVFDAAGEREVSLTVADNDGAQDTDTVYVTAEVAPNVAPTADFTVQCDQFVCTFDAGPSFDPDGEIVEYSWSTSDGATGDDSVLEHEFPGAETYEVTLSVTDNDGESAEVTKEVTVSAKINVPPVAEFSDSCDYLSCTFDGSASTDSDGEVVEFNWTIDNEPIGSGEIVTHTFDSAESYDVTLEVVDDSGATGTVTRTIAVTEEPGPDPVTPVAFVGSAANVGTATSMSHSVTIPAAVSEGDLLVAILAVNAGNSDVTTPAGWDTRASSTTSGMKAVLISKVATGSDAGSQLVVQTNAFVRGSLSLAAYRNASVDAAVFAMQSASGASATHVTPELEANTGDWEVSYWSDKTASTTGWTLPGGLERREHGAGTGAGHLSWQLADSNGPVATSTAGGVAATADSSTSNAVTATVIIGKAGTSNPDPDPDPDPDPGPDPTENEAPVAAFTDSCEFLVCTFNGSGSTDADGEIVDYAWTVGDDQIGSDESVPHTFGAAGSYDVTLTVTDNDGATGTLTRTIAVSEDSGPNPDSPIEFVGTAANPGTATATAHSVTIPSSVQPGDLMVAILAANAGSVDFIVPAGWETRATEGTSAASAVLISKVAATGDADSQLVVRTGSLVRGSLTFSAYRNATADAASFAMRGETSASATHVTPEVNAPVGAWVVSYWSDKTAATTAWTLPDGLERRQHGAGTGAGRLSWQLADTNGPVSAGTVGGVSATSNASTVHAIMATIALTPNP